MQVGGTSENPETPLKSELCALKTGFKPFQGQSGRVTGEVITTETGQNPMNWGVIYAAEKDMKELSFGEHRDRTRAVMKKVQSHFFSQVIKTNSLFQKKLERIW